ncbi:hypothetical protein B0H11DRAFT_2047106, partial [Mycena galericulata]
MCPSRSPLASFAIFSVFGTSGRFIIHAHTPCYTLGLFGMPFLDVKGFFNWHSEWIRPQIPCSVHFEHLVASGPFC